MKYCALCPDEITNENDSKEHIIPNSIGGRKKVKGFICRTCNSTLGEKSDVVLATQFNWFSLFIGVKRERGRGQPPAQTIETANGKRLLFRTDGTMTIEHPIFKKTKDGARTQLKIETRTIEEAKKILKNVAKKHPDIDVVKLLEEAKFTETPLDSPIKINIQFGGPFFGSSVVKTAFAFASQNSVPHQLCDQARNYLKNIIDEKNAPYGLFYLRDLVKNRPTDKLFHCVAIMGDSQKRRLLAYVEYFGFARLVVNLSSDYQGQELMEIYAIDPTTGQEIDLDIDLNLSVSELKRVLDNDSNPLDEYTKAVNHVIPIAIKLNFDRERNRVVTEAAIYAFERLMVKPDCELPPEDEEIFVSLMMEKITPFLIKHMKSNQRHDVTV
jgi:hypothetical protein